MQSTFYFHIHFYNNIKNASCIIKRWPNDWRHICSKPLLKQFFFFKEANFESDPSHQLSVVFLRWFNVTGPKGGSTARGNTPGLTHDKTLRMVCGCLAKAIGSKAAPARPAPNDPTPSISLSVLSRLHGGLSIVGTGPVLCSPRNRPPLRVNAHPQCDYF